MIRSVASLAGGVAEAIELPVDQAAIVSGQPLGKINLPKNVLFAAIIHNGRVAIPTADDYLQGDDRVILVGLRTSLPGVEKLFKPK